MSEKHVKFDLLENALDSLFEAYREFKSAEKEQNIRRYKFVIFHVAHFFELFIKYAIFKKNPLLIYKKHYEPIKSFSKTLSFQEAIEVASNLEMALPLGLRQEANWLYERRNELMHYQFNYSALSIKESIPKILKLAINFDENNSICNISNYIKERDSSIYLEFISLIKIYNKKLEEALKLIEEEKSNIFNKPWEIHICEFCGNKTLIPNDDSPSGYQCTFCGNQESSDLEIVRCEGCGERLEARELENGYCDYCSYQLNRDD